MNARSSFWCNNIYSMVLGTRNWSLSSIFSCASKLFIGMERYLESSPAQCCLSPNCIIYPSMRHSSPSNTTKISGRTRHIAASTSKVRTPFRYPHLCFIIRTHVHPRSLLSCPTTITLELRLLQVFKSTGFHLINIV